MARPTQESEQVTLSIRMSRTSQSPDHPKRKQAHIVEQTQLETVMRSSGRGVKSCSWWERKTKASSCEWTTQSENPDVIISVKATLKD